MCEKYFETVGYLKVEIESLISFCKNIQNMAEGRAMRQIGGNLRDYTDEQHNRYKRLVKEYKRELEGILTINCDHIVNDIIPRIKFVDYTEAEGNIKKESVILFLQLIMNEIKLKKMHSIFDWVYEENRKLDLHHIINNILY